MGTAKIKRIPAYLINSLAVESGALVVGGAVGVALVLQRERLVLQLGPHLARRLHLVADTLGRRRGKQEQHRGQRNCCRGERRPKHSGPLRDL